MDSVLDEDAPALPCRIRLVMEAGTGGEVAIDLEESLEGSISGKDVLRMRNRIASAVEERLVPAFRRELWDWAEKQLPDEPGSFEDEFARRCDRNDDVIDALEWLSPHVETEEEGGWKDRMVDILMAREENEAVR